MSERIAEMLLGLLKAALFYALGSMNYQLYYLVFMIGVDVTLGTVASVKAKEFRLKEFARRNGIKLALYVTAIAVFNAFDQIANLPGTARWLCLIALAGIELISALKNISKLGYPQIARALEQAYRDIFRSTLGSATPVDGEDDREQAELAAPAGGGGGDGAEEQGR